jgi:hypothetical protein
MASRARRIDTRRMFAFLAGSFLLVSTIRARRIESRNQTSRRSGEKTALDQLKASSLFMPPSACLAKISLEKTIVVELVLDF